MGNCEYHLDLTNLPVPPDDYRVSGTNVSVLDAVSQLCEDAGFEFFIDLIPAVVEHELGYFYTVLILKVRCVYRTAQPNLDAIENFIDDPDNLVMESSNGREFRNDVTSAMVIGGKKTNMYAITFFRSIRCTIRFFFSSIPRTFIPTISNRS